MKNGTRRTPASLLRIVVIALVTRPAFAWYQEQQFNSLVLSVIPFQAETDHIACFLASGKGFSSPFQRDSGPTPWLAPVYAIYSRELAKCLMTHTLLPCRHPIDPQVSPRSHRRVRAVAVVRAQEQRTSTGTAVA